MRMDEGMKDLGEFRTTDALTAELVLCRDAGHVPEAEMGADRIGYECKRCGVKWAVVDAEEQPIQHRDMGSVCWSATD